jgi:hypothetical protein
VAKTTPRHGRVVARLSGINGREARASGMGGFLAGESDLIADRSGRCCLARLAIAGMSNCVAVLLCWPEQSKGGERREREGERKEPELKLNFLKISNRNFKNFEHESCRKFENL